MTWIWGAARQQDFPGDSSGKESACNSRDLGSIPGQEDPLEEGMATHSRILAWIIPWTEEPGGLQSIALQSWTQLKRLCMHACTKSGCTVRPILQVREW